MNVVRFVLLSTLPENNRAIPPLPMVIVGEPLTMMFPPVLVPALAAGSIVIIGRTDMGALVVLLLLVSAYETGDYLMGAEADSVFEGPLSGMAAVLVVTFAEAVLQLGPFETRAAWVFGALVATLAPLGAPLGSALVPSASVAGPALRRLDAWFLAAPVWALLLVNYLSRI